MLAVYGQVVGKSNIIAALYPAVEMAGLNAKIN